MKVTPRKITPPQMPSNTQLLGFACKLIENEKLSGCRNAIVSCLSLTLAIAPDNERDVKSLLFYLQNLAIPSGITHTTIEAVGLWLAGMPLEASGNEAREKIYENFRNAYLFSWQKRLITLAIDSYNELMSEEHPFELCEIAYRIALSHFEGKESTELLEII